VSVRTYARRSRRPGRAALPLVLALGVAVVLTGCGRSGVAASVAGRDITVDHVQSAVASLRAADKAAFGGVTDSQVLAVLIYGPYAEDAASGAGKGISDDAVRQAVVAQAQQNADKTADVSKLNAAAIEALRGNIAFSQLDDTVRKDIMTRLQTEHVKVSPRYGTFDPASGTITAPSPNWLTPAATPSATPSATG
jgi:hypothetical protein